MYIARVLVLLFLLSAIPAVMAKTFVPAPLQPWTSWVLDRVDNIDCTPLYHSVDQKICTWIGKVTLDIDVRHLQFQFPVRRLSDGWQALPGTDRLWPQEIRVGGNRAAVVSREGVPSIWLGSGTHVVKGVIHWSELPQSIRLPSEFAMIQLKPAAELQGRAYIDGGNRLWLVRDQVQTEPQTENLTVRVFRKLTDSEPKQMDVVLQLEVSGNEREVILQTLQLPGWALMDFQSPLPARIEDTGALRMQVRPGIWQVTSSFRQQNQLDLFRPLIDVDSGWPLREIWVVQSRPGIRRIAIEGEAVDPQQTSLPEAWKALPAYKMGAENILRLRELSRGVQQVGENRLWQDSEVWLSFNADRWIWKDQIRGEMSEHWRLEQKSPFILGHTKVDGQPRLITQLSGGGLRGAEVRRQQTQLEAVSIFPVSKEGWAISMPVSGWSSNGDFEQINTRVNLPPGWWPVAVQGADRSLGSWLDQWTLWDVFLWLLIVAVFWRMEGPLAGSAALIGLAFAYHETASPIWVWLTVLIPLALLRVVKHPIWKVVLNIWRWGAFLGVVAILLNYSVDQIRMSIYPQLEQAGEIPQQYFEEPEYDVSGAEGEALPSVSQLYQAPKAESAMVKQKVAQTPLDEPWQTGPGVPDWHWNSIQLGWSGGIADGQEVTLLVLSPAQTRLARIIHVALLGVLLASLLGHRRRPSDLLPGAAGGNASSSVSVILAVSLIIGVGVTGEAKADGFPSPELLGELKARLTEAPVCMPQCADLNSVELVLDGYSLTISMELSVMDEVVVPVPAKAGYWVPQRVFLDGREVKYATTLGGLPGQSGGGVGNWSLSVGPGVHEVVLEGGVREKDQFKLFFPLQPKKFSSQISDWVVSGANEQGMQGAELGFERTSVSQRRADSRQSLFQEAAPAFVRLERTIELGVQWRVRTRVIRLAPLRGAISMSVPLLPGENVLKGDASAKDGYAQFTLPDLSRQLEWESALSTIDRIDLVAPSNVPWTEHWEVFVSPHWRVNYSGVAPYQIVSNGVWQPRWQPRPGDSVLLEVSKPMPVAGQLLTIDRVDLRQEIGGKSKNLNMDILIRSSKSQRFRFELPVGGELQSVRLNGQEIPRGNLSEEVDVVLGYGAQNLQVNWTMPVHESGWQYFTPNLQLPVSASNINLTSVLPGPVWPVWTEGPEIGPAVLFWGVLVVTLAVAYFLGGHEGNPLGRGAWLILALGATLGWVQGLLILVVWFYSLNYRAQMVQSRGKWIRRGYQVWLVLLTIAALGWVIGSIPQGLIGQPIDYVAGNGSSMRVMHWYTDVVDGRLPEAWVVAVPVMFYRVAILLWALWLAFAMLKWLQWGWGRFSEPVPNGDSLEHVQDEGDFERLSEEGVSDTEDSAQGMANSGVGISEVDSSEVDGSEVDGSEVDGSEVDGSEVDSNEATLSEVDGDEVIKSEMDHREASHDEDMPAHDENGAEEKRGGGPDADESVSGASESEGDDKSDSDDTNSDDSISDDAERDR
ncbi:hypothetical protein BTA51_17070 [Hahella sp. CCB-MM4]|uniref:hypothetical protein n=1 Tax=Hahella sp. (strain CCB-MM4) TaxID=1926491 RepID=UPI000B9BBAF8|nr:hypothetical protein [Hahella sp. CCB-MM4]OZG72081.1 hypothetical protein BTA51_17070 [Hahella sp. CCB-MM4]